MVPRFASPGMLGPRGQHQRRLGQRRLCPGAVAGVSQVAGDNGNSDAESDRAAHVALPAFRPPTPRAATAPACGSTPPAPTAEIAWKDGTGRGATCGSDRGGTGRGATGVAGGADPATGFRSWSTARRWPSAVPALSRPLWAGLVCRSPKHWGRHLGLLQPSIHAELPPASPHRGSENARPSFAAASDRGNSTWPQGDGARQQSRARRDASRW